jgi:cytoskeletal protein RodZ
MYNSLPPEGVLDPKVPWSRINPNSRLWLILKARLTGRPQGDGYNYSSYVNISNEEADRLIANMKKDPRGYPSLDQESGTPIDWMERQRLYQEWLVENYLGKTPKQKTPKPDKELDKTKTKSGETKVYKPEDKFVDDVTEELDQKLEETSNQLMDVVDEFIKQQNQAYEDFKKKQEEERAKKQERVEDPWYSDKTPTIDFGPVSPTPSTSISDPWEGSATVPPKPIVEQNDDWENEVPEHIRKRLDELVDQVQQDPLPQPTDTKRKKTKGKKKLGSRKPKFNVREMGLGESLNEILQNVIETKDALFEMYKVNRERFEFKKKVDAELTQSLSAKLRESQLEKPEEGEDTKSKEKKEMGVLEKSARAGLFAALAGLIGPLVIDLARPFFETSDKESEENPEPSESQQSLSDPTLESPASSQPGVNSPDAAQPSPIIPITQINQTDIKSTAPPQTTPLGMPLKTAATGGKFISGDKEPLRPITKEEVPIPEIKKLTKPITESLNIPKKVSAVSTLSFANAVLSPFASFIPKEGKTFINNMFQEIAQMAGVTGLQVRLKDGESVFDMIRKLFGGGGDDDKNGNGNGNGSIVPVGATSDEEEYLMRLMIAEAGGEGEMGMAAVARAVINRSGLVKSGKMKASQFNSKSGSITDIIQGEKQFSPYAQGKLDRKLSESERSRAYGALQIARNEADYRGRLEASGLPADQINKMTAVTGFRNYDAGAGIDTSQQVNEMKFGRHTFNTAGNAGLLYMPYTGTDPQLKPPTSPKPPEKPEQKIDKPQTLADRVMDAFKLADTIMPTPFQQPPIPKLDIPGLTNQSSSSQSSRSSSQQPGF